MTPKSNIPQGTKIWVDGCRNIGGVIPPYIITERKK